MVLYVHISLQMFSDVYDMCSDSTVLVHAVVVIGMKNIMFLAIWKGQSDVNMFICCLLFVV